MFSLLKIKLGGLLNRVVSWFHKVDDTPETVIECIVNGFEEQLEQLVHAVEVLDVREQDNLRLIHEIEQENSQIQRQSEKANRLGKGLNQLLNGGE